MANDAYLGNTFHLIIIPDEDLDDNIPLKLYTKLNGDGGQSKYFGFLASVFHSNLPSRFAPTLKKKHSHHLRL